MISHQIDKIVDETVWYHDSLTESHHQPYKRAKRPCVHGIL